MTDFKIGDRVRLVKRHPAEGWLGLEPYKGLVGVITKPDFMHRNERYYRIQFEGETATAGVLHTMLEHQQVSPFEARVLAYIQSELLA